MTPYQKNIKGYKKVQVATASPQKLLMMVYDGTIKFLKSARVLSIKSQHLRSHEYAIKGVNCVIELISTLNHDESPEIAGNLHSLYIYVIDRIKDFLSSNSLDDLDEAIRIISGLKASWQEAFSKHGNQVLEKTG